MSRYDSHDHISEERTPFRRSDLIVKKILWMKTASVCHDLIISLHHNDDAVGTQCFSFQ